MYPPTEYGECAHCKMANFLASARNEVSQSIISHFRGDWKKTCYIAKIPPFNCETEYQRYTTNKLGTGLPALPGTVNTGILAPRHTGTHFLWALHFNQIDNWHLSLEEIVKNWISLWSAGISWKDLMLSVELSRMGGLTDRGFNPCPCKVSSLSCLCIHTIGNTQCASTPGDTQCVSTPGNTQCASTPSAIHAGT